MANTDLVQAVIGYHQFIESEFPEGKGKCDSCGGLPDAPIHHKPPEPIEVIAAATQRIAEALDRIAAVAADLQACVICRDEGDTDTCFQIHVWDEEDR